MINSHNSARIYRKTINFPLYRLLIVIGFALAAGRPAAAVTINAKSVSLVDVTAAIASANDGDTVLVPAGQATWASSLVVTKGITLVGATTITGNAGTKYNADGSANTNRFTIVDATNITFSAVGIGITFSVSPGKQFTCTGFTFTYTGGNDSNSGDGIVTVNGSSGGAANFRFHHNHIILQNRNGMSFDGWVYGVVDHNRIEATNAGSGETAWVSHASYKARSITDATLSSGSTTLTSASANFINAPVTSGGDIGWPVAGGGIASGTTIVSIIDSSHAVMSQPASQNHTNWTVSFGSTNGSASWADDANWGSSNFVFFEDNEVDAPPNGSSYQDCVDCQRGGRNVWRFNYSYNTHQVNHGSDSGAGGAFYRGCRAQEYIRTLLMPT